MATYVVKVDPTTLPSTAYDQTGDPDPTKDNKTTVIVIGANVADKDFGYREIQGSISGTVVRGGVATVSAMPASRARDHRHPDLRRG